MKATYTVKVHVDADGDMVIVQNPTLAPAIEKSDYEPKTPETDASVDADTVNDATAFLETFFKLYPTATEKELAYYVSGNVIESIGRDYLYSELVNPIFTKDGDNVKVKVAVKFLDNQTKAIRRYRSMSLCYIKIATGRLWDNEQGLRHTVYAL